MRKQKRSESGFTLMELLIVIAIIAVLVAIAIPAFAAQLDNAKDTADKANARALYALAQADWMSATDDSQRATFSDLQDHKVIVLFADGNSQAFTFSDRTDSVVVEFFDNGAHVTTTGKGNGGAGFEFPEG
ncbi:MAG: type II secretion system protein [Eggerthellaceae bacterium]|nr:type II secretion system protein [Eggerthellaceae bacterium]